MKKIAITLSALLFLAVMPVLVRAADESKTGELVDIKCYLTGKAGEAHAGCAETCAKGGLPVGLLVEDGGKKMVYLVMAGKDKKVTDLVAGKMGKKVTAMGAVADKDGLKVITVTDIKAAAK